MTNDLHDVSSAPIQVRDLGFRFGRQVVFDDVTFAVPQGALYALLGPNGAGKTTLMQTLMGIRRDYRGSASVLGRECSKLRVEDRQRMGYVAEGLKLPAWMRLEQLEAYLAPMYPTWDAAHATSLRTRFELDSKANIGKMSRGQYMKTALLCALASRPEVLLLDEPFTGIDVSVKDELVRGLLSASTGQGCTIVLSSHDISELELLADWVGFLGERSMKLSESMESVRTRFRHVDVMLGESDAPKSMSPDWMSVEQSARHLQFVATVDAKDVDGATIRTRFSDAQRLEIREATLKEVFLALQRARTVPATGTSPGVSQLANAR